MPPDDVLLVLDVGLDDETPIEELLLDENPTDDELLEENPTLLEELDENPPEEDEEEENPTEEDEEEDENPRLLEEEPDSSASETVRTGLSSLLIAKPASRTSITNSLPSSTSSATCSRHHSNSVKLSLSVTPDVAPLSS